MNNDEKTLYNLKLFEIMEPVEDKSLWTSVMRVPGGWIFRSYDKSNNIMSATFVRFDNEYQPYMEHEDEEIPF